MSTVYEKAKVYYPKYWNEKHLHNLVILNQLTEDEVKEIIDSVLKNNTESTDSSSTTEE